MGIRQHSGNQLRAARSAKLARPVDRPVPPALLPPAPHDPLLPPRQPGLHLLVQHPVQRRLHHAQVAGAHALVQPAHPFLAHNLPHAVGAVPIPPLRDPPAARRHVLVKLQPRLDHPDRVRHRGRHHARRAARQQVAPGALLPVVPVLREELLAVAVDVEVDGAGRHHADEVGPKALEERPPALGAVDGAQDLQRVREVVEGRAGRVERGDVGGGAGCADLRLVEVGLEAGFQDVEGRCEGCRRHASNAAAGLAKQSIGPHTMSQAKLHEAREVRGKAPYPPAIMCTQDLANGSALTWPLMISSGITSPVSLDWMSTECSAGTV